MRIQVFPKILFTVCLFTMIAIVGNAINPYQTFDFSAPDIINKLLMNTDLDKMTIMTATASTSRPFYFYTLDQNNITLISQTYSTDTSTTMTGFADNTMSIIVRYGPGYKIAKVYKRVGIQIIFVHEFTPLTVACTSIEMSADARFMSFGIHGVTKPLVTYEWNGTEYLMTLNSTLNTPSSYRAMSPDGLYLIYGQKFADAGSSNLRILQNSGLRPQIWVTNFTTLSAPTTAQIVWIGVGQPQPDKYDIVCLYSLNSMFSAVYLQFDSSTNSTTPILQTIISNFPTVTPYWNLFLTQNGKYMSVIDRNNTLRVYEKQSGQYVQIYYTSQGASGLVYYTSEDASLVVIRSNGVRTTFFYRCEILNCVKCQWINHCQVCEAGFVLTSNGTCVCAPGTQNHSGTCISCSISNCQSCWSPGVCSSCGNGYSLAAGNLTCVCPLPKNISSTTNKCVTCAVTDCYKCSEDDVCDLFVSVSSVVSNSSANSTNGSVGSAIWLIAGNVSKNTEDIEAVKSIVIVLVVLIGVMFVGLVVVGVALWKAMKSASGAGSMSHNPTKGEHLNSFSDSQILVNGNSKELNSTHLKFDTLETMQKLRQQPLSRNQLTNQPSILSNQSTVQVKSRKRRMPNTSNSKMENDPMINIVDLDM